MKTSTFYGTEEAVVNILARDCGGVMCCGEKNNIYCIKLL